MATTDLIGTRAGVDQQGMSPADRAAHAAASYIRRSPEVVRAVTRFEVASERYRELTSMPRDLTGAEFDALVQAQATIAESREFLASAGLLHLIGGVS